MGLLIENYGDLKTQVQSYIDRDEPAFVNNIDLFIALAERKMFRQLRCPANEKILTYNPSSSGVATLPEDYLEVKHIRIGNQSLQRISEHDYFNSLNAGRGSKGVGRGEAPGAPEYFARVGNEFRFYPLPETEVEISLYYWADLSGQLETDEDTTEILRVASDLYLYGACMEAQPWLKNDARLTVWSEMFKGTLDILNGQRDEAEYSGSNIAIGGAYGDY